MDMMTKMGGRKFFMAVVTIAAALFLEIKSEKGLTPTMAGFLVAVVGAFSAANLASSAKYLETKQKPSSGSDPGMSDKLDQIHSTIEQNSFNREIQTNLLQVLGNMQSDLIQLKETSGQIGKAVINSIKSRG